MNRKCFFVPKIFNMLLAWALFLPAALFAYDVEVEPGQSVTFTSPNGSSDPISDCGGPLNSCNSDSDPNNGRLYIYAAIIAGADQDIFIEQYLRKDFEVTVDSSGADRLLDAQITGSVDFEATLQSSGIFNDRAELTVKVSLWDRTEGREVAAVEVFNDICASNFPDAICLHNVDGPRPVSFPVKVQRGHKYQMRLTARCEAHNTAGGGIQCSATDELTPIILDDDGFIQWNEFTISIDADLIGEIADLTSLVETLQTSLDLHDTSLSQHDLDIKALIAALDTKVDENNSAILENRSAILELIRLSLTPQGKRATELVDCTGQPGCDFPNGKQK